MGHFEPESWVIFKWILHKLEEEYLKAILAYGSDDIQQKPVQQLKLSRYDQLRPEGVTFHG